jgi:hypothetical protein
VAVLLVTVGGWLHNGGDSFQRNANANAINGNTAFSDRCGLAVSHRHANKRSQRPRPSHSDGFALGQSCRVRDAAANSAPLTVTSQALWQC